ncbi:MAG: murein L,D-transpeptidase [Actinomycetia bacterium]|nr:murein L,D-transpeptidase [Actinomycetes bacterium]
MSTSTTEGTSQATTSSSTSTSSVAGHQESLTALGYWLGEIDGQLGPNTVHAVTAFQKAEELPRTGQLDPATVERLAVAVTPAGRSTAGAVIEIDLARQILLVVSEGQVQRIYDTATGAPATPTPAGQFEIYHEIDGYRYAPLGTLYRPKYFNGGIALHGYTSVPAQPASHGCIRVTYAAMDHLWATGAAPIGTPVWVY